MAIEFVCPACRGTLRVADDAAGRVVRCGSCLTTLRVPVPPAPESPPPVATGGLEPEPAPPPRRPAAEPVGPPEPPRDRDRDEYGEPRPRRRRRPPPPKGGRSALFWIVLILLLLGFLTAAACGGAFVMLRKENWRPHASPRGGFTVELPADPRHDMAELAKTRHQPNVSIEGTLLIGRLEEYSVVYTDVPVMGNPNATLDAAVQGMKKGEGGEAPVAVLSEKPVAVSGYPGREIVFSHPDGGTYQARLVVAGGRLYIATAGGPWMTAAGNPRTRRFLDSFRITNPNAGGPVGGNPWRQGINPPPPDDNDDN